MILFVKSTQNHAKRKKKRPELEFRVWEQKRLPAPCDTGFLKTGIPGAYSLFYFKSDLK